MQGYKKESGGKEKLKERNFVKAGNKKPDESEKIFHYYLCGKYNFKYDLLGEKNIKNDSIC